MVNNSFVSWICFDASSLPIQLSFSIICFLKIRFQTVPGSASENLLHCEPLFGPVKTLGGEEKQGVIKERKCETFSEAF